VRRWRKHHLFISGARRGEKKGKNVSTSGRELGRRGSAVGTVDEEVPIALAVALAVQIEKSSMFTLQLKGNLRAIVAQVGCGDREPTS